MFLKLSSGMIFANPNCFGNGKTWRYYVHDSWLFKSGYLHSFTLLCRQDSRMKLCVLLSNVYLGELVCPKRGERPHEKTVLKFPQKFL